MEAFLVHDWNSLYFPAYSYVASGIPFYAARAASVYAAFSRVRSTWRMTSVVAVRATAGFGMRR